MEEKSGLLRLRIREIVLKKIYRPIFLCFMMAMPMDKECLELYLEQYRRCYTMWVHLNSLNWQVPTTTFLSVIAIVSLLQYLSDFFSRAIIFFLTGFLSLLMTIQMAAHRRGLDLVTIYMKYLEEEIFKIRSLPLEAAEAIKFIESHKGWVIKDRLYNNFLVKQRSYFWFQYALLLLCVILWSLAIYNIVAIL